MGIDLKLFRAVMGRFATGVTVVAFQGNTVARGMTANAFASVSLDPPLVLVCIDNRSVCLPLLREGRKFSVNVLAEDQLVVSDWFSGKARDAAHPFEAIPHAIGENGVPVLEEGLAVLECDIYAEHPGGDHTIVIGLVTRAYLGRGEEACPPLLFYAGRYRKMAPEAVGY